MKHWPVKGAFKWRTVIVLPCMVAFCAAAFCQPPSEALPQYVNTNFEGASPLNWEVDSVGHIVISLIYDHERASINRSNGHWLFQVQGTQGQNFTLVLQNFDNIWNGHLAEAITGRTPCAVSADGKQWKTIQAQKIAGNKLQVQLHMDAASMYVSEFQPYRLTDLQQLLASISNNPLVAITTVGATAEGRPLEIIRVGSPAAPNSVFIRARAHGYEAGGNWVAQGLITRLLQQDATAANYLQRYCLYVLPMANKDAVARGKARFNSRGMDLNRNWGKPADKYLAPENYAIEQWLDSIVAAGKKPKLMIDLHNDAEGHLHLASAGVTPAYLGHMKTMDSLLRADTWYTEGIVGGISTPAYKASSIADAMLQRYGIDAFIYEFNWEYAAGLQRAPSAADWLTLGGKLGKVLYEYFDGK